MILRSAGDEGTQLADATVGDDRGARSPGHEGPGRDAPHGRHVGHTPNWNVTLLILALTALGLVAVIRCPASELPELVQALRGVVAIGLRL
jgi:hypothetical protein